MVSRNIEGKVVVITGASSGLGEATARLLCTEGATVVLGARRGDGLQSLADKLTTCGGKALDDKAVDWMEKVTDEQYQPRSRA